MGGSCWGRTGAGHTDLPHRGPCVQGERPGHHWASAEGLPSLLPSPLPLGYPGVGPPPPLLLGPGWGLLSPEDPQRPALLGVRSEPLDSEKLRPACGEVRLECIPGDTRAREQEELLGPIRCSERRRPISGWGLGGMRTTTSLPAAGIFGAQRSRPRGPRLRATGEHQANPPSSPRFPRVTLGTEAPPLPARPREPRPEDCGPTQSGGGFRAA